MIELHNVSKTYHARNVVTRVLDDVTIRFPRGKSVGILGWNGAGKSTLIRLLGGIEPPDSGTIKRNVKVSWPLGFSGGFQGSLTGRENARFIARIYGAPIQAFEQSAEEFAELGQYFDMPVKSYSSGMRSRLAFAVSLAADFECYLVDEITAVGDQRFKDKYRAAFVERKERASMIIVSHNVNTIKQDSDIAAVLRNGKLEMYEDVNDAIKVYQTDTR